MLPPPHRADVRARLLDLLAGRARREEVADWAGAWVADPAPEVDDPAVWRCLVELSGADLWTGPGTYLHGELDVRAWLDALDRAEEGRSGWWQE